MKMSPLFSPRASPFSSNPCSVTPALLLNLQPTLEAFLGPTFYPCLHSNATHLSLVKFHGPNQSNNCVELSSFYSNFNDDTDNDGDDDDKLY